MRSTSGGTTRREAPAARATLKSRLGTLTGTGTRYYSVAQRGPRTARYMQVGMRVALGSFVCADALGVMADA